MNVALRMGAAYLLRSATGLPYAGAKHCEHRLNVFAGTSALRMGEHLVLGRPVSQDLRKTFVYLVAWTAPAKAQSALRQRSVWSSA